VKRPILVLLAAVALNLGVVGSAPARAASPDSPELVTPAHHHHGRYGHHHHSWDHDRYDHRHHPRDWDDDGDDHGDNDHNYYGGGHHHHCVGLIAICLL
jgi:hypothetical protein